jgi:hypothetical protein
LPKRWLTPKIRHGWNPKEKLRNEHQPRKRKDKKQLFSSVRNVLFQEMANDVSNTETNHRPLHTYNSNSSIEHMLITYFQRSRRSNFYIPKITQSSNKDLCSICISLHSLVFTICRMRVRHILDDNIKKYQIKTMCVCVCVC